MNKKSFWIGFISKLLIVFMGVGGTWLIWSGMSKVNATREEIKYKEFLGQKYIFSNKLDKAETYFEEILNIDKNHEGAKIGIATVYALEKKYNQSEKMVLEVIEEHHKKPQYYRMIGLVKMAQKKFDEAKEYFIKAKELRPKDGDLYDELIGRVEHGKTMIEEGNEYYSLEEEVAELINEIILDIHEKTSKELGNKAEIFNRCIEIEKLGDSGNYYELQRLVENMESKFKNNHHILKQLGKAYMENYALDEAEGFLTEAYLRKKDDETASLLAELLIYRIYNDDYGYNESYQSLYDSNNEILEEINAMQTRLYLLNQSNETDSKEIEVLKKTIEKYNEEITRNKLLYFIGRIKDFKDNIYLKEKKAKLMYLLGNVEDAEKNIDNLLLSIVNNEKDRELTEVVNGLKFSNSNSQINNATRDKESYKLISLLNKYTPKNWLDNSYNQDWNNYIATYLSFREKKLHIVDVDTSLYPEVTAYVRVNGVKYNEKRFNKKDFKVMDNGKEVKDFKILKDSKSESNIMVLLDTSGSMDGSRIEQCREAAVQFVNQMTKDEKILFAAFDDTLHIETDFVGVNERDKLIYAINNAWYGGGTDIYGGINESLNYLEARYGKKAIVILTDGEDSNNDSEFKEKVILRAQNLGVPVFSIGLESGYKTLQEISYKTGGEFFYTSDSNKLNSLYSMIREQLDKDYRINFTVSDKDKQPRYLKVTLKGDNITDTKMYLLAEKGNSNVVTENELYSEIVSPKVIYKGGNSNISATVTIDLKDMEDLEEPFDVYINNYKLDSESILFKEGILTLKLPKGISENNYDITLYDKIGREYTLKNGFTVKNIENYNDINIGNITLSGDSLEDNYGDYQNLSGEFLVNNMITIDGDINIDRKSNKISGNGKILAFIAGQLTTVNNGYFELDTANKILYLNNNTKAVLPEYTLELDSIELLENGIEAKGEVGLKMNNGDIHSLYIENFQMIDNNIEIKTSGFDYSYNSTYRINDGSLIYENGEWKGEGSVYLYSPLSLETKGNYKLKFDRNTKVYSVDEMNLEFGDNAQIKFNNIGFNVDVKTGKILDPASSLSQIILEGDLTYQDENYNKPLNGRIKLSLGTQYKYYINGALGNDNIEIGFEGVYDGYSDFYGDSSVKVLDDSLADMTGKGQIWISDYGLYGLYEGEIEGTENQVFEITNNSVVFVGNDGVAKEYNFIDKALISHNLDIVYETNKAEALNIPADGKKSVIQISWLENSTDLEIVSPEGKIINSENAQENNVQYIKEKHKAYYILDESMSGSWKAKPTNEEIGEYVIGVYKINNPPKIDITEVKIDTQEIEISWEVTDEEEPLVDIYLTNENGEEKIPVETEIETRYFPDGYTLYTNDIKPGDYILMAVVKDGKNIPVYGFYKQPITVLDSSLPAKVKIKDGYRINNNVVIELEENQNQDLYGYRVYEVMDNGKINYINYIEFDEDEAIVLNNVPLDKKYRIAAYNYYGEGLLSEEIDIAKLKEENPIVNVQWNPEKQKINKPNGSVKVDLLQQGTSDIYVNGEKITSIENSYNIEFELQEGYNEVLVQTIASKLYDENLKEYTVDTKPPVLKLNRDYQGLLFEEKKITISGNTEPNGKLLINGEEVKVGNNGEFVYEMQLEFGKNYLEISVEDGNGNKAQYTASFKYYGNPSLMILLGFGILYILTILAFVIAYKIKKRKIIIKKM